MYDYSGTVNLRKFGRVIFICFCGVLVESPGVSILRLG